MISTSDFGTPGRRTLGRSVAPTTEKNALVRQALRALIERESARRLGQLGGSEAGLEGVPRRQTPA